MKNPQIVTKLNSMMAAEKQAKINAIGCILDHYRTNQTIDIVKSFDELYELDISQLNDIMSDLISDLYNQINYQLERFNARK